MVREDAAGEAYRGFPGRVTDATPAQISGGFATQPEFGDFLFPFADERDEVTSLSTGCYS